MHRTATEKFIKACDESPTKSISDICRRAGMYRQVFYHRLKNDPEFKKQILKKQQEAIGAKVKALAT